MDVRARVLRLRRIQHCRSHGPNHKQLRYSSNKLTMIDFISALALICVIAFGALFILAAMQIVTTNTNAKRIKVLEEDMNKKSRVVEDHNTGFYINRDTAVSIRVYENDYWEGLKPTDKYLYFVRKSQPNADYAVREDGEWKFYKKQDPKEVKYEQAKK